MELERRLRVTDGVLRFITVRIDEEQAKLERFRAKKSAHESAKRERRGEPEIETPPSRSQTGEEAAVEAKSTTLDEAAPAEGASPEEPAEVSGGAEEKKETVEPAEEVN